MADYTESFASASDPLAGDWTTLGSYGLRADSGVCDGSSSSGINYSALIGLSFDNDQSTKVTLTAVANFDNAGVGVRMSAGASSANGYVLYWENSNSRFNWGEVTNGTITGLGVYSSTMSATDTFKLGIASTTLTRYKNDSSLDTTTDSTWSSGVPGLYYDWGSSRATKMDDLIASGYTAGGGLGIPLAAYHFNHNSGSGL